MVTKSSAKGPAAKPKVKPPRRAPPKDPRRPPRPPPRHLHARLNAPGKELAAHLAKVAVRTLYAGATRNAMLIGRMKEVGKHTPEFEELTKLRIPADVVEWIRQTCWKDGVVRRAVESELAQALYHAAASKTDAASEQYRAAPAHLRPMPEDEFDPEGPGPMTTTTSCCTPLCGPP